MDSPLINKARIMFVDDEISILQALRRVMRNIQAECLFASSAQEALEIFEESPVDVVISDMKMPEMDGAELLAIIADRYPETVRIILSGYSDNDSVMSAINDGRIWGYINKPWDAAQLVQTIEHAINTQQVVAERALLRRSLSQYQSIMKEEFEGFVGSSVAMQFIYNSLERAAPSSASVFITGESGTGKEVAAQAIHSISKRSSMPFIAINCAAIPGELMESEIFGHLKGAFSGAINHRDGAASLADGGTLFLDELSEMDIGLQAKLLRFIQTGEFQKVGSNRVEKVDIRFVCATNRDPLVAIADNKLREDLYYRLNVISINLPSLIDRDSDAILLAQHFLQSFTEKEDKILVGFSQEAERFIEGYRWPGNVRQLENAIYSAVVMSEGPLVAEQDIKIALGFSGGDNSNASTVGLQQVNSNSSSEINRSTNSGSMLDESLASSLNQSSLTGSSLNDVASASAAVGEISACVTPLHEVERITIENAVKSCEGNVVKAASLLEVSPSTLYRKIQSWKD